jgi:uncharacterized protein (DUF4415 family)
MMASRYTAAATQRSRLRNTSVNADGLAAQETRSILASSAHASAAAARVTDASRMSAPARDMRRWISIRIDAGSRRPGS